MIYKIAIIYTTFLRDSLMFKTTQSIIEFMPENSFLLIADQGYHSDEKKSYYEYLKSKISCEIHYLPFDCGAYCARNHLIKIANEKNIPYCLISADSIYFKNKYDFSSVIEFLESKEKSALVGFELEGSKCSWEYKMELTPKGFKFSFSDEWEQFKNKKYLKIDISRNIYLAKTKVLLDSPYDEELKLGGHELNFWNLKQKGYECYWTNDYIFKRHNVASSNEYLHYRNRLQEYLKIVRQKLNMTGWVIYPQKRR